VGELASAERMAEAPILDQYLSSSGAGEEVRPAVLMFIMWVVFAEVMKEALCEICDEGCVRKGMEDE